MLWSLDVRRRVCLSEKKRKQRQISICRKKVQQLLSSTYSAWNLATSVYPSPPCILASKSTLPWYSNIDTSLWLILMAASIGLSALLWHLPPGLSSSTACCSTLKPSTAPSFDPFTAFDSAPLSSLETLQFLGFSWFSSHLSGCTISAPWSSSFISGNSLFVVVPQSFLLVYCSTLKIAKWVSSGSWTPKLGCKFCEHVWVSAHISRRWSIDTLNSQSCLWYKEKQKAEIHFFLHIWSMALSSLTLGSLVWVYVWLSFSQLVQSLSRVRLFATPWIAARQASLSITNSQSSLKLMSIESMMPSSHLILCRPFLLLPPHPSQHQSLFQWVNSSHEVAKVLEFQL